LFAHPILFFFSLCLPNLEQDGGALLGAASMGLVAQFAGVPLAMHATAALQAGAATLFLLLSRETAKAHAAAKAAKAAKDA
jgi:hypothetical protein